MEVGNASPIRGYGADLYVLAGSFQGNGASDPATANSRTTPGFSWTVVRDGAVGLYKVSLAAGCKIPELPVAIDVTLSGAVLATDQCSWMQIGDFDLTNQLFRIQLHRAGTAFELPATAGNRVNFKLFVRNTTGK